jgi:ESCRT-II complex subunit VPS22
MQEQFKSAGEEVRRAALQQMKDQLVTFKSKLEEFALKHKSDIRRDPVFRAQFHTMCANIGVDPLASNKVGARVYCAGVSTERVHGDMHAGYDPYC